MRVTLKAARVNAGYTQKEVCKKLKIGEKTLQNWETGATSPRADRAAELCDLYGCELTDVIFFTN